MKTRNFISELQVILPQYSLPQEETLNWIKKSHLAAEKHSPNTRPLSIERLIDRYGVSSKLIEQRYFETADLFNKTFDENEVYQITDQSPAGKTIEQRHHVFAKASLTAFEKMFKKQELAPSHLIHVTCTGYLAPSPAQVYSDQRGWDKTEVTHAYHMGCYASLPAVRLADSLAHSKNIQVDVAHTEICSLHMNPTQHDPEQLVVQSLFADGHICYKVGSESSSRGFEIISIKEQRLIDSTKDMTWQPAAHGMTMTLSKEVPVKIKANLKSFFQEMALEAGIDEQVLLKEALFAIHPGGPKIIEVVQEVLELNDEQTMECKAILKERGNMSSATLPHVWERILQRKDLTSRYVVSFAFGPGLTLFGSIFKVKL